MANGWQTLGTVLGGGIDREGAFMQGQLQSAKTTEAIAKARMERDKQAARERAGTLDFTNLEAVRGGLGDIILGGLGSDYAGASQGVLRGQEFDLRALAADPETSALARTRALGAVKGTPYADIEAVGSKGFVDITQDDQTVQPLADALGMPVDLPSSIQEWNIFSRMSPEEQRRYLQMKRAVPTFKMGDVTMLGDPITETARPFTEQPGETQAEVQRTLSEQAAEGVAMQENVKAATKLADESFKRLEGVKANIANYDEAIRLIDEGAQTGVITSRLPSVRQASIALDNLQGRLGLDVIGNTTFGALSEAELKFALNTALPQNMQPQALKVWLQQKRDAQEKLAAYLEQASIFLGTPGNTVKDWIELQRSKGGAQPLGDALTGPSEPQTPPPTNARGWRLMSDASGNMAYVSPDGSQFEEVH